MSGSILFTAIVFLLSAITFVPIAKKFGLSSVLGYLMAGIIIGPCFLGLVGTEGQEIMHFAEFGVVVMLFLVGLEIDPKSFWKMKHTIIGMGLMQVAGTICIAFSILYFLGINWKIALTMSMAISLSSTAIVLQSIKEKGMMRTTSGTASFSILLFQDIIVIFMIGALPLLSNLEDSSTSEANQHAVSNNLLANLPIGFQTLAIVMSVVLIVILGRYLIVPMLRRVASTGVRELLIAAAILIVLGISFLMEIVGLSPALGAFLGGVVLANSEFKHELESTLDPFKGILLGLFFMAVGATINFMVISSNPLTIGGLIVGVVLVKAIVLFAVGAIFKLNIDQRLLLTVGLAQIGEFAFVLLAFARDLSIFGHTEYDMMVVVIALSMTVTPVLSLMNERLILPRFGTKEEVEKPMDEIGKKHKIILVGFGHFGSTIGRFLRGNGIDITILDQDSNRVDLLRKLGFEVYYGDATRIDLLESAGIEDADLLICAIDNPDVTLSLVKKIKKRYPSLKLMIRAKNRYDAYELLNEGIDDIYRESLDTSIKMACDVLCFMGFDRDIITSQGQKFIKADEESLRRLSQKPLNGEDYIFKAREEIAMQERLLQEDLKKGKVSG